jgi:hypothetical protein
MFTLDDGDTLTFGKTVGREILVHPISVCVHLEYSSNMPLQSESLRPFRFGFMSEGDDASEMSISDDEESSNSPSSKSLDENVDYLAPSSSPAAPINLGIGSQVAIGATQPLPPIQGLLRSLSKCIPFSPASAFQGLPHIRDLTPHITTSIMKPASTASQASNSVNIVLPSPPSFAPMSPTPVRYQCHATENHISHT